MEDELKKLREDLTAEREKNLTLSTKIASECVNPYIFVFLIIIAQIIQWVLPGPVRYSSPLPSCRYKQGAGL